MRHAKLLNLNFEGHKWKLISQRQWTRRWHDARTVGLWSKWHVVIEKSQAGMRSHPIPVQNEQIQRLITNFEFLSSSYPPPKRRLKKKRKWWERTWKQKQWNWWRREVLWKLRWMSSSTASVSLAVLVSPATSSILRHINSLLLLFLGFYVSVAVKICRVFLVLIYFLNKF